MPLKFPSGEELLARATASGMRRVLVITALPLELAAVRSRLINLGSVVTQFGTLEFEQFSASGQEWLAVVGESGAGNLPASQLITHTVSKFGPFELILFVGVAASRKKADAPIGTVMAARHVYMADIGKHNSDGTFSGRARMLSADRTLLALAQKIARETDWHNRLRPPYGGATPGDAHYPTPFPPAAIICPIVSVEAVSADPNSSLEQHISQTYQDAVGLEMEGYGALQAAESEGIPCIVIRGVSDTRGDKDPELDKIFQPVAAGHATAFALELLDTWSVNVPPPDRDGPLPSVVITQPHDFAPVVIPHVVKQETISIVVHLPGNAVDYPPKWREEMLDALKAITGDAAAEIVGMEEGSFHLFIKLGQAFWDRTSPKLLSQRLSDKLALPVIGITTEQEFRDSTDLQAALLRASRPLLGWPQTLPGGTRFERPELQRLLSLLAKPEGSTTALLGLPGSGKTALLGQLAQHLQSEGVTFLAIKADLLGAAVATEQDLQEELNLPDLPSNLLVDVARVRPVVLIVDQLDALAGYLDLKTGRLSALLNLVRRVGNRRNIHIILSARTFEFEHDARLKSVQAESITLDLPAWSVVLDVLHDKGIKAEGWPVDAQQVLRTPQHLATFLNLSSAAKMEPFLTYQAMLEKLWQERLLSIPDSGRAAKLAGEIAEDMAEREALWVARAKYDDRSQDIQLLLANGILTDPGTPGSIGFSHQTVFEYALARSFAQKEGRLSTYILGREASLFVRPKLWSALTYLRAVDPVTYESETRVIWDSPDLRAHLRHLIIEFLGQQQSPLEAEAAILQKALKSDNRRTALQAIVGSKGWFQRLRNSDISSAMSDPDEAKIAAVILSRMAATRSDEVIGLIERWWIPDRSCHEFAWHVLQESTHWGDRHLIAAKEILAQTEIAPFNFDYLLSSVGAEQPSVAIQLALARLNLRLVAAKIEAERRASIPKPSDETERALAYLDSSPVNALTNVAEENDGWDALEALAKGQAKDFLDAIWPWFQELLVLLRLYKDEHGENDRGFSLGHVLDLRFEGEGTLDLSEYPILASFRTALETFAAQSETGFRIWLAEHDSEDAEPAQRLFAHALASNPERYHSLSLDFLLQDPRRFHLGNIEDYSETTKRLVRSASIHWSQHELQRFIAGVDNYNPQPAAWRDAKSRQYFLQDIGRLKLELLEMLPQDRLSAETLSNIAREQRRFGERRRGAMFSGPMWIGSPMTSEEVGLASDDDVINAFRELPDETGWDNPKTWMKGGNIQLSRAFADYAKTSPERAIGIVGKLTPENGARAAGYALDAMAEGAEPSLILGTIADLEKRGFAGEEYRGSAARAVERLLRRDVAIDDDMLTILISWLATPAIGRTKEITSEDDLFDDTTDAGSAEDSRVESVLWGMGGVSVLPHGNYPILEVIVRILLQRRDYMQLLEILTAHLDKDEDEKVWGALVQFFRYIAPEDKTSLKLFLFKLFRKYPKLLESRETAIAFAYMHWTIPDFIGKILDAWKTSPKPAVQQAYGEIAALIWLVRPELAWATGKIEEIMASPTNYPRTGAAFAAVNVWADSDRDERSSQLLVRILGLHEKEPWIAALDLFRLVDEISPSPEWSNFLNAVLQGIPRHKTFPSTFVIDRLQTLLPYEADLVGRIALSLANKWSDELADLRTGTAADAPAFVDVAITLHRLGPETREVGTQLFEKLLFINAYTAKETLNQIDNKFLDRAFPARPRLPRRNRRANRRRRQVTANPG